VDTCIEKWGLVPYDMALFARHMDRGSYEVRFTGRLQPIISDAAPHHYIEEAGPPRGSGQRNLQVVRDHWPDELGIELVDE
jgi:hypothetical protein